MIAVLLLITDTPGIRKSAPERECCRLQDPFSTIVTGMCSHEILDLSIHGLRKDRLIHCNALMYFKIFIL